jgi:predicted nucleic acid-binding protein
MEDLFKNIKRTTKNKLVLLDTCFIIELFQDHKEKELLTTAKKNDLGITSYTTEELLSILKKTKDTTLKNNIVTFFTEHQEIKILDIPVQYGDEKAAKKYVADIDPYLAEDIPDPSDAIIFTAAIKTKSIIVTKDKHTLFSLILKDYLVRWNIKVIRNFKEL